MNTKEYNDSVDLYADGLYRFALKSINNRTEAEDLVQDAFEKLWLKKEHVDPRKAKSYLFTTIYHSIVDWSRKQKHIHALRFNATFFSSNFFPSCVSFHR